MLVKDIIKLSCELLDMREVALKLENNEVLTEEENTEINELVKCFNLVREEIATEVLPIVKIDSVKTENLKVDFNKLASYPVSIIAVKDIYGRTVRHRVMEGYLIAFANEVEIWYSIKPEVLTLDSEFSSTLPERVYAYGVAREQYIKKSLYKDAEVWENRFKNSLEILEKRKTGVTIPRRRWL